MPQGGAALTFLSCLPVSSPPVPSSGWFWLPSSWGGPLLGRERLVACRAGWEGEPVGAMWLWLWAHRGGSCLVRQFCVICWPQLVKGRGLSLHPTCG